MVPNVSVGRVPAGTRLHIRASSARRILHLRVGCLRWVSGISLFMRLLAFLAVLLLSAVIVRAGSIKVSFFDNEDTIVQTSEILRGDGCKADAISRFRRAVARYKSQPPGFDVKNFPREENGFFTFDSASNLVAALPQPLSKALHPFELTCFDLVILLTEGLTPVRNGPDELAGPFLAAWTSTNGETYPRLAATARDAFAVSCPSWYVDATQDVMGTSQREARMCLMAGFFCFHVLPNSTSDAELPSTLLKVLRGSWARQGLRFPTNVDMVLYHQASLPDKMVLTSHAGLLLHRHSGYTYLEKTGGCGPFVRVDFGDLKDLTIWFGATLDGGTEPSTHPYFVTFNDREIKAVRIFRRK